MNKKIFHGAILESVMLNLISENCERGLHGYAIADALNKKFGVRLGPSTIYPELKHMEKQGLLSSSWDFSVGKARRQYRITRKGQGLMMEYKAELKTIIPTAMPIGCSIKKFN